MAKIKLFFYVAIGMIIFQLGLPITAFSAFQVFAEKIRIRKYEGRVYIDFAGRVKASGAEGLSIISGNGEVVLTTDKFPQIPENIEKEKIIGGELPSLPKLTFDRKNLKLFRLGGGFSLVNKDLKLNGGTLETRDGGDNWMILGSVKLINRDKPSQELTGKNFHYNRMKNAISTKNAVEIASFWQGEKLYINASSIEIRLQEKKILISGNAVMKFSNYTLSSNNIKVDTASRRIETDGPAKLTSKEGSLDAAHIVVTITDAGLKIEAKDLSGKVIAKSVG